MIDHMSVYVTDFARSKAFYAAALKPLGYALIMEFPDACGFGQNGKPDLWIMKSKTNAPSPTHFAIVAADRKSVDGFYAAAMQAGAKDNGGPGLRKEYHESYYGAFVHDPDQHNVEAVTHRPE